MRTRVTWRPCPRTTAVGMPPRSMRRLLDDALAPDAMACVLASTAMAHDLYLWLGFQDMMPMVGFQTRKA
jgi:hypothetical protein